MDAMKIAAEMIARELAFAKAAKDEADKRYDELKQELLTLGVTEVEIPEATIKVSKTVRITLDAEAIRKEMGEPWCDDHSKLAEVTTVRVAFKTPTKKVA